MLEVLVVVMKSIYSVIKCKKVCRSQLHFIERLVLQVHIIVRVTFHEATRDVKFGGCS